MAAQLILLLIESLTDDGDAFFRRLAGYSPTPDSALADDPPQTPLQ